MRMVGVAVRIAVAVAVCATALLGFLPAWLVLDDLFVQDHAVVSGRVLEKGAESFGAGRGTSDRLLLTIEGQPYVFFRSEGWFSTRAAMLDAIESGQAAAVEVRTQDLAGQSAVAPNDRRIEIVSLVQNGTVVFTRWGLLLPQIAGALILAPVGLLALALALLLIFRPSILSKEANGSKAGPIP